MSRTAPPMLLLFWLAAAVSAKPAAAEIGEETIIAAAACDPPHPASCPSLQQLFEPGAGGLAALRAALRSQDGRARRAAARLLARDELGTQSERRDALLADMEATPDELRGETLDALARVGGDQVGGVLARYLGDPRTDPRNRIMAANGLGATRAPGAAGALAMALADPVPRVQQAAAANLALVGDESAIPALANRALEEITAGYVRIAVAGALGRLRDRRGLAPLVILLASPQADVREAAARALGALGDVAAIPALLGTVTDRRMGSGLVAGLAALRDKRSTAGLVSVVGDGSRTKEIRKEALWVLGSLGDPGAVPGLARLLGDEDVELTQAVVEALGRIGTKEAAAALVPLLRRRGPEVERSLLWALRSCAGFDHGEDPASWKAWLEQQGAPGKAPGADAPAP